MTQPLAPSVLTREGAGIIGPVHGPVLIVACGALAREVLAIVRANGWEHIALTCLPAILHNHPDQIPAAVETAVSQNRGRYRRVFVAYADCGTGGQLRAVCDRLGVEMIEGPHCYSFFEGNDLFASRIDEEFRAFYLTDFLARQFDAFVWEPLGLDRHPELRDAYFGHYTKLVYQAQTEDPELDAAAQDAARRLDLTYERRSTGYGELATSLASLVTQPPAPERPDDLANTDAGERGNPQR